MTKTIFEDGLWKRETHYGEYKITLTTWRTPHAWETEAKFKYGSVTCNSDNPLKSAKSALHNLRLNIPIWADNYEKLKNLKSYINAY